MSCGLQLASPRSGEAAGLSEDGGLVGVPPPSVRPSVCLLVIWNGASETAAKLIAKAKGKKVRWWSFAGQ